MPSAKLIYLNGHYLSPDDPTARISPFDRGFLFGDSVYEVVLVYQGQLLQPDDHFDRLVRSLCLLDIPNPHSKPEYQNIAEQLINASPEKDLMLYLQVSRGMNLENPFYRQVPCPDKKSLSPTVFAYVIPTIIPSTPEAYARVMLTITQDIRWEKCEIKSNNLLPNVLIRTDAEACGAYDGLLLRDGHLNECAGNNVFMVKEGKIFTPPDSPLMLSGTMRKHILRLAKQLGIACEERPISLQEALAADELWACCTTRDILPVTHLLYEGNRLPVGHGEAGPVWRKVIEAVLKYRSTLLSKIAPPA
jgi:D-alanine transaminase